MNASIRQTIEHWGHIVPYIHIPRNESEYERLLKFLTELMEFSRHKKDERVTSLLKVIAKNIESYESIHYPTKSSTPVEVLEFLMEEHGLSQSDLPEIGSQSLVSKIISGERQLTLEHIRQLSKRFNVLPSVFVKNN